MPRPPPVWGFPAHYNPNLMGDRCEVCRASVWLERQLPPKSYAGKAWICAACILPADEIPQD